MRHYESAATINASPEAVWSVLKEAERWPDWNSGVEGVDGQIALGQKITIRSAVAPGRAFPVKVTSCDEPRRLTFTGGMPLGLFKGVRTYDLESGPAGTTTFRMREEYTGPMVPMIWNSMPDLAPSFEQFVTGLKARVEHGR